MNKEKLKEIINNKLKWVNMRVNDQELDEIIKIYDYYLDLLLEATSSDKAYYQDRYGFIEDTSDEVHYNYFNIFYNITVIKKENIESCIDYLQLFNSLHGPIYNIVNTLLHYTNKITSICIWTNKLKNREPDLINYFYNSNERLITTWLDDFLVECIDESSYISNDYKEIIKLYRTLSKKLGDNKSLNKYTIPFEIIINISYYYFMVNNYFNTDTKNVISFLQYMINNPIALLDQINMAGIPSRDELIDYFDSVYKNKNSIQKVLR